MEERKKPWFDRFLDKHPYFPLGISCVALIVALLKYVVIFLKSIGYL